MDIIKLLRFKKDMYEWKIKSILRLIYFCMRDVNNEYVISWEDEGGYNSEYCCGGYEVLSWLEMNEGMVVSIVNEGNICRGD